MVIFHSYASLPEGKSCPIPCYLSTGAAEDQRFDLLTTGQLQNINSGGNPDWFITHEDLTKFKLGIS